MSGSFERLLAKSGGDYLIGAAFTVADISLYDVVFILRRILPDMMAAAPTLAAWFDRVAARTKLKAYFDSGARLPVNANGLG